MIQIPSLAPVYHHNLIWMIDLETLATRTSAVIPEVSVVAFEIDTGRIVQEKTWNISVDEQLALGRTISSGTLAFWLTQSTDARTLLLNSMDEHCNNNCMKLPVGVDFFLEDFKDFITVHTSMWELENAERLQSYGRQIDSRPEPMLMGNGPRFDMGKVAHMYEEAGRERDMPWSYWSDLDVRALNRLAPGFKKAEEFVGVPHYGLDDCKHQIKYVAKIYQEVMKAADALKAQDYPNAGDRGGKGYDRELLNQNNEGDCVDNS